MTPLLLIGGVGLGLFIAPATNIVLAGVRSDVGAASGVLATVQNAGGATGVAAVGVLYFTAARVAEGSDATRHALAFEWALGYEVVLFLASLVFALSMPTVRSRVPDEPAPRSTSARQ